MMNTLVCFTFAIMAALPFKCVIHGDTV